MFRARGSWRARGRGDAGPEAVLGDVADAGLEGGARVAVLEPARRRRESSPSCTAAAPRSPRPARAGRSRDARDRRRSRPRARSATTPWTAVRPRSPSTHRSSTSSTGRAVRPRRPFRRGDVSMSWPTMSSASDCASRRRSCTVAITLSRPQHGDAVRDGHHLVQLVRDEDHRPSLCRPSGAA